MIAIAAERQLLDGAQDHFVADRVQEGMDLLVDGLRTVRDELAREAWLEFIATECATHGLRALLFQDPFSRRCAERPRGYPGDAVMLDLIYRTIPLPKGTTRLGARIYSCGNGADSCVSVRARRAILAAGIDRVAASVKAPRILSVACGHLREARLAASLQDGRIGELIALDQDRSSLKVVQRELARFGVKPVQARVRELLTGRLGFDQLDLAYAAGLYDYLSSGVARALTANLFGMLRPGGELLVANFAPNLRDIGYMEAFLDWHLIYRDEQGMWELAEGLPDAQVESVRIFRDPPGNIVYLQVGRRAGR